MRDLVPWPVIKPGPLYWKLRVLTTASPKKPRVASILQAMNNLEISLVLLLYNTRDLAESHGTGRLILCPQG